MTENVVIAQKAPFQVELKKGERYFWCACGRSANQPFCDGSHKGTGLFPIGFVADDDKSAWLCGCKHSSGQPYCDGTHKTV